MTTMDAVPLVDAECVLTMDITAPGQARAFVVQTLSRWRVPHDLVADAETLASELVTNAVRHAAPSGAVTIWLGRAAGVVRCEVLDPDPAMRPIGLGAGEPSTNSEAGRGLRVVEALATRFGIHQVDGGKTFWFELAVPGERRFAAQPLTGAALASAS